MCATIVAACACACLRHHRGCGSVGCVCAFWRGLPSVRACDARKHTPAPDSPLLETYRLKRELAKQRCNVHSNLSKALIYCPAAGAADSPAGLTAVRSFQVAGTFVGDADACRADALALVTARLRPLDHVMLLEDSEHVKNALQLKFNLVRLCASKIFGYWASSMPPEQTDLGAAHSDATITAAIAALARTADSPAARAELALACAAQPAANGGIGITLDYAATSHARFVASFIPCWSECRHANSSRPHRLLHHHRLLLRLLRSHHLRSGGAPRPPRRDRQGLRPLGRRLLPPPLPPPHRLHPTRRSSRGRRQRV